MRVIVACRYPRTSFRACLRASGLATGLWAIALAALASCGGPAPEPFTPGPPPTIESIKELVDDATLSELESATRAVQASPRSAAPWNTLGEIYEVASMPAEAESAYLAAAGLEPDEPKHAYRAAIAAEAQGESERALTAIDRAIALDPSYGPAWRRRGAWLLDLGRPAEARSAFKKAATRLVDAPDASIGLARTALLEDKIEEAETHAREAVRIAEADPSSLPYARLILGDALRRAGRDDEATPHLEAGQGATPSYRDPWSEGIARRKNRDADLMAKAQEHESQRDYASALAAYDSILSRRPDDTTALHRKGTVLLALKRPDVALSHFESAVQRFPGDYELLVGHASALRRTGAREDALFRTDAIVARWPERPTALLLRGQILGDLGRLNEARRAFQRAKALAPKDLRPQLFEARMLLQRDRAEEAAQILTAATQRTDVVPSLSLFQATLQAQVRAGVSQSAIERTYRRAVELHGDAAKEKFTTSAKR